MAHSALVDEQVLTGEARPVLKEEGDDVLGGTLNLDGDLTIQVTEAARTGRWRAWSSWSRRRASRKVATRDWPIAAAAVFVPAVSADRPPGIWVSLGSCVPANTGCGRVWRSR